MTPGALLPPSSSISRIERSGVREVMDLARGLPGVLHLEVGEPDFPTPPHVIEAAAEAARAGYTRYTDSRGLIEVREAIAAKMIAVNGIAAGPEGVVVTCGAVNALLAALTALTDPGDLVLLPDPGWPNYRMMATILGLRVERYPLLPEEGFQPDLDRLEDLVTAGRPKVVVVNSPANPTGSVFPQETLERIVRAAARSGAYLVSDECYEQMVFEGVHISPASFDETGRVVSVFSVSKTYSMTGWRIGYLAAPPELAALVTRVQEATISCPPAVNQKAAQAALEGDQSQISEMRSTYRERRDLAVALLGPPDLLVSKPEGTFYLMARVPPGHGSAPTFCRRLLQEARVAVAPGDTFGPAAAGGVRLSLTAPLEELRPGLERLVAFSTGEAAE